jgi:hypothetical protein
VKPAFLHRSSKRQLYVSHPLAHYLKQFLPTLNVGTAAIGIFFKEHCLAYSTSMIEIKVVLDQEPAGAKRSDEELVDLLAYSFADRHGFPGGQMAVHHHPYLRQTLAWLQSARSNQSYHLIVVPASHASC